MKNQISPFIISLLLTSFCYSQTLGRAQIEVKYHYEMLGNRLEPERKNTDETILLIGDKYTSYFSYMNYIADSLRKANPAEFMPQVTDGKGRVARPGETAEDIVAKGGTPTIIPARTRLRTNIYNNAYCFINRELGEVSYFDKVTSLEGKGTFHYSYKEILEKPVWKITNDTETIAGYHSQKATTRYGGRNWTVWFTSEIPISEGPWKLRGLPGLILKAETADGEFVLTATSVSRSTGRPIVKDEENVYRNISKKEFVKLKKEGMVNPHRPIDYNHIEIFD